MIGSILCRPPVYLAASVGMNIFLLGFVLGQGPLLGRPPGHEPPPEPQRMVQELVRQLPPEDGRKVEAIYAGQASVLTSHREDAHLAMGKVVAALRTEPLDQAALVAAIDGVGALDKGLHQTISAMLLRAGNELSPEGRRMLADIIERGPSPVPPRP